ncbi:MAG: zf-HC2 domain-containing protein [Actinomycetota bacterium]|nr:zf-HC2 domain-containing protein [Actinomycetota bacterium]
MEIGYLLHGSHEETQRLMSEHAEGELRGYARWRVSRHLAKCEMCRALYRSFLDTLAGLRALGRRAPAAKPELADSVVARIHESDEGLEGPSRT